MTSAEWGSGRGKSFTACQGSAVTGHIFQGPQPSSWGGRAGREGAIKAVEVSSYFIGIKLLNSQFYLRAQKLKVRLENTNVDNLFL